MSYFDKRQAATKTAKRFGPERLGLTSLQDWSLFAPKGTALDLQREQNVKSGIWSQDDHPTLARQYETLGLDRFSAAELDTLYPGVPLDMVPATHQITMMQDKADLESLARGVQRTPDGQTSDEAAFGQAKTQFEDQYGITVPQGLLSSLQDAQSSVLHAGEALAPATLSPKSQPDQASQFSASDTVYQNPVGGRVRGCDAYGCGYFGATRKGEESKTNHKGTDYEASPGQRVVASISGKVTKIGYPYDDAFRFRYVEIASPTGVAVKTMYVSPGGSARVGNQVSVGDTIGTVQSLQSRYPGITDHVHVEIRVNGSLVDPTTLIP